MYCVLDSSFSFPSLNFRADLLNSFLLSIQLLCLLLQAQKVPRFLKVFRKTKLLSIHLNLLPHLIHLVDSIVLENFQQSNPHPLVQNNSTIIFNKYSIFLLFSVFTCKLRQVWCVCKILPFCNQAVVKVFNKNLLKQILYLIYFPNNSIWLTPHTFIFQLIIFFLPHSSHLFLILYSSYFSSFFLSFEIFPDYIHM